jgi:hypothetical protein
MNMRKLVVIIYSLVLLFAGCDDLEDKPYTTGEANGLVEDYGTAEMYILNEGLFNLNNSTLARYSFLTNRCSYDYFRALNHRGLGDTANDMDIYGSKLYVVVNVSSTVEVIDLQSGLSVKQIPMLTDNGSSRQPRAITFDSGKAVEINKNRKYPFEATGRTGALPFVYKTYQTPHAAMGSMSGWGNYYWQQIYCMASMGKDEKEKATLFIPGSYTPINGFTDQKGLSALCVFNRLPTMWHLTQWKGDLADYRETFGEFGVGFTDKFKQDSQTSERIVLKAYGYDVHIFPFELENGKVNQSSMECRQREKTSPRYHTRPAHFKEYVFNEKADWFGVVVKVVKSGEKVKRPEIFYKQEAGIHTFSTLPLHMSNMRFLLLDMGVYAEATNNAYFNNCLFDYLTY